MKLSDSLNGQYAGLYGEVVTEDCYRIKQLKFAPDLIIDIGANVGVFSSFAAELFPDALIVAVEPHPDNISVFRDHTSDKIILIPKAIGMGQIWHPTTAANGSGECYLSEGLGYRSEDMSESDTLKKISIETIMPDEIINTYWRPRMKMVIKVDCEGAENIIFEHEPSMEAIRQADYVAMEFHLYAHTHEEVKNVEKATMKAFKSFEPTHHIDIKHREFFAIKKVYNNLDC